MMFYLIIEMLKIKRLRVLKKYWTNSKFTLVSKLG